MAIALRQSDPGFGVVDKYYAAAKREPTGSGNVTVSGTESFDANFLALLKALKDLKTRKEDTIVIVAHGGAGGLIMAMSENTDVSALDTNLTGLVPLASSYPNLASAALTAFANNAGIKEPEATEMAKLCSEIQKAGGFSEVHFRGCKIGKNKGNLDTFRSLLGATKVTAPSCPMLYASFAPRWQKPSLDVGAWKSKTLVQSRRRDFQAGSSSLALDVDYNGSSASTQGAIQKISDFPAFATTVYGNPTHGQTQSMFIAAMWPDGGYFLPHESGYGSQIVASP